MNEPERYAIIEQAFRQFQNSVLYQCHLPYNLRESQSRTAQYEEFQIQLTSLRQDILSTEGNQSLIKLYQTWNEKYFSTNSVYFHFQQQKVPTGTGQVQPILTNSRFLLSRICFLLSQISFYNQYQIEEYVKYLKESYIWYPKSVQVLYLLAEVMKINANCSERLQESEYFLRKAIGLGTTLQESSQTYSQNKETMKWVEEEYSSAVKAGQFLLLYLYQTHRIEEADAIIKEIPKYSWRINHQILNYLQSSSSSSSTGRSNDYNPLEGLKNHLYYIENDYLPNDLFAHLREAFQPSAPFWSEHSYNYFNSQSLVSGYFSYLYPMKTRFPLCSIEQIIDQLYGKLLLDYPDVFQEAQLAEWWVHSRPHCGGHQLHYDSDESRIALGGTPNHPVATVVLYLSSEKIGGPTMVSDQLLNQTLGTHTWLVHPKENRIVVFNAKYLHGVIPGVGEIPSKEVNDRRLTLMIGFWKKLEAKDQGRDHIGAGQPFPLSRLEEEEVDGKRMKTSFSWSNDLQMKAEWSLERSLDFSSQRRTATTFSSAEQKFELDSLEKYNIQYVSPFWIPLKEKPAPVEDYESFYQGF
jgi:hypothetical protein